MELVKLKILVEMKSPQTASPEFNKLDPIVALFNPNRIEITKIGWQDSSKGVIPANQPATLTTEFFFDTSLLETKPSDLLSSLVPTLPTLDITSKHQDVRQYTKKIYQLTEKKGDLGGRPPICRLVWGINTVLFEGILKQLTTTFSRFLADGTPVRATLNCTFEEWQSPEQKQKKENPIDDPIRIVRRGETLSSIAAEEYNDPSLWRIIARENRIDNPRKLTPGQSLTVPPLRPTTFT